MNIIKLVLYSTLFPGLSFVVALTLFHEWIHRKLAARLQNRMGPSYTGPFGLLQPFYDLWKLMSKEDLAPATTNDYLTGASLVWALVLAASPSMLIPWTGSPIVSFQGDVIIALASLTLSFIVMYLVIYPIRSPYPIVGGLRLLGLLTAAEVGYLICISVAVVITGSTSIGGISSSIMSVLLQNPLLIVPWLAAVICGIILLLVEAEMDPFTIAEAETEVAGGFYAEFSGRRLAFAYLISHMHGTVAVYLYVATFFGLPVHSGLIGFLEILAAGVAIYIVMVLIDTATPRLRLIDAERMLWLRVIPITVLALIASMFLLDAVRAW